MHVSCLVEAGNVAELLPMDDVNYRPILSGTDVFDNQPF
jgi:hypothetical protein